MPIQTSYSNTITPYYAGQIANEEPHTIISRTVEDAAGIGFGKVVVQGAAAYGVIVPAGGGSAFRGVTVRDQARQAATPDVFARYEEAAVMTKGVVIVSASVAVNAGDPAYFVPATGVITNVATNNTAMNAVFDATIAGAGLVPLRLN